MVFLKFQFKNFHCYYIEIQMIFKRSILYLATLLKALQFFWPILFISVCFIYFKAPLLGAQTFKIIIPLDQLALYHSEISFLIYGNVCCSEIYYC